MPENHEVTFSDLKVDDIRGAVTLDAMTDYSGKWREVYRALRELGPKLRSDFGFRGSPRTDLEDPLSPSSLAGRGPEGVKLAEAALASRAPSKDQPRSIVMYCDDPAFKVQVDSSGIRFLFDAVQSPDESLRVLKQFLDVILDKLDPVDLSRFGIQFRHVFYLQPETKNVDVIANGLLEGQSSATGFFEAFGKDLDWARTDLAWLYHRRNSELLTHVKLESPGNDNNTQIWFSADTQTSGDILDRKELDRLSDYLAHYQSLVESLLSHVLCGDLLDTHRREMMVDAWFKAQRSS